MGHEGTHRRIHEESSRYSSRVFKFNLGDRTYSQVTLTQLFSMRPGHQLFLATNL